MTSKFKIAGIGELLWDMLPDGKQLGGAPCNFAYHALQVSVITNSAERDKSALYNPVIFPKVQEAYDQ